MADAPKFDCRTNATAEPGSTGETYEFDASSLVNNGALAVAILPTAPADRVVLSAPDANSLAISAPRSGAGSSAAISSGAPSYASPVTPAYAAPAPALVPAPAANQAPSPGAAPVRYVPTLVAAAAHARAGAVVLALLGAVAIGAGWFVIGRVAVQRALAEGRTE